MNVSPNTAIFVALAALFGAVAIAGREDLHLPGNQQGYAPAQPIPFSHRLHAGELGLDCLHCHYGARTSKLAGIPPTGLCMNCHASVSSGFDAVLAERAAAEAEGREPEPVVSPAIVALRAAMALDPMGQPVPGAVAKGVPWVAVHELPDFVHFDHSVHVARGLACQTCHGPVQTMDRVRQESDLSMGWCVDCHRSNSAEPRSPATAPQDLTHETQVTTDCNACHV